MINKINPQKNFPAAAEKSTAAVKTQAHSSKQTSPAKNVITRAASPAALGLPSDKLSSSIISFARFFSLPLKPQLLADIRRNAFAPPLNLSTPAGNTNAANNPSANAPIANTSAANAPSLNAADSAAALKFREALSLAAAAAESKGAELQPKGLEQYADAIDPQRDRRQDGRRRGKDQDQNQEQEKKPVKEISSGDLRAALCAQDLKQIFDQRELNDSLLEILNKLPGKDAKRWIVIPFDFSKDEIDFRVSMRILLDENKISKTSPPVSAGCMALDIFSQNNKTGAGLRRMLFVIDASDNVPIRAGIFLHEQISQKEQSKIKRGISRELKIPAQKVFIRISDESFPYEAGGAAYAGGAANAGGAQTMFPSIDEAV